MDRYDDRAYSSLGEVTGALGVLSATWPEAYKRYVPVAKAVFAFDHADRGRAIVEFRTNPAEGLKLLDNEYGWILDYRPTGMRTRKCL